MWRSYAYYEIQVYLTAIELISRVDARLEYFIIEFSNYVPYNIGIFDSFSLYLTYKIN